jgi:polysaccharide pyruvyl transferase WcaK-like protein
VARERASESPTITFFGNFGAGNLGNECTLQAIIQNTRRYLPAANINCVCTGPREATSTHGIPAALMSYRLGRPTTPAVASRRGNPAIRLVRRLVVRLPREVLEWGRAFRTLEDSSMLVMTGTGMLSDFGIGPLDLHYEILKWSVIAKLRGCKLLFVSVGAGPIRDPLSRLIVKIALSLADYRSYRDRFSREYLESIGFDTSEDRVCPDLAFSLDGLEARFSANGNPSADGGRVVGVGLMEYYGQHHSAEDGEGIYQRYIESVARFAAWLLEQGHSVRLLIGDLSFDTRVKRDLLRSIEKTGSEVDPARIIDEPLTSPQDLYAQLARTDMVVATRFHNVLLALMLNRPVIALSYHDKVRALMAESGFGDYCQEATELDLPILIERFRRLAMNSEIVRSSMKEKTDEYRRALDEQYRHIFGDLGSRHLGAPRVSTA